MSRLDSHVTAVQNRLALRTFCVALAWTVLGAALLALVVVVIDRALSLHLLVGRRWYLLLLAGVVPVAYAIAKRPGPREAAVAIDDALGLKEKFSTALFVRPSSDPFAKAAVIDAEHTAQDVNLQRQFPIHYPRVGHLAALALLAAVLTAWQMPELDLFGRRAIEAKKQAEAAQEEQRAKDNVAKAIAQIEQMPKALADTPQIQRQRKALSEIVKQNHFEDPAHATRKAQEALQDVTNALKDEAERTQRQAMEQKALMQQIGDVSENSPVGKVAEDMKKGDYNKAVDDLTKLANNFDKMSAKEQEQAAKDMQKLAQQLQQAANNPGVQQQIQKQIQQLGATPQQAQQMAQAIQQAAQGNPQAQQQVAQQAQQLQAAMQQQIQQAQAQAAQGNAQAQQQLAQLQAQQQQIQQAIQGMQAQANAQAQAGQMGQATQQMAQAMQQAAQQAGQQQGQQGQQGQQAGGQQGGQQAGGQQGQQPAGQQGGQQGMAAAQQQMQNALQQMQDAAADAQQAQAQQQAAQQAAQQANGGGNNGQPNPAGNPGQGQQGGQGQWDQGDPNQNQGGNGPGGPGVAMGGQTRDKTAAPFQVKSEMDAGRENDKGRILSGSLIKDNKPIRGSAKVQFSQVVEQSEKQASEEVEEDHVSGQSREAAKRYFQTMQQDAPPAAGK